MMRTAATSDPRLRLYRFVFEHVRDPTIVFDADGRAILLNRAARDLPSELVERLFATDSPKAAELAPFRAELTTHGHAHTEVCASGRALTIDARAHGSQYVVTVRDLHERRPAGRSEPVNVEAVLTTLESLIARVAGSNVEVAFELGAEHAVARLDRERLEHALLNLAANARDAMPRGGRLTLRTALVTFDASEAKALDGATAGAYIALQVTDTGVGMNSEVRERMFEAFVDKVTTHDRGMSVGLAAVRRFAADSGGCIAVHSEENRGTTVALYFPSRAPETGACRQDH